MVSLHWLAGWLFANLTGRLPEPTNYAVGLSIFQALVIPALLCYIFLQKFITKDKQAVAQLLAKRAQT